jgi:tetratricopeptide (TPR) repeat protein
MHMDIKQILAKSRRLATVLPSNTVIRQQIPLKPAVFHGRDGLVEEITHLLMKEETSRVCILGPGGMGKTAVLLAVVESSLIKERFSAGNCVWVPCIEATSATLLLEILYTQLQVPGAKEVTVEKILSELNASKQPHLILLDNFETPWNAPGGTQTQVGDLLHRLAMLSHIAILITMRETYPPCDDAIEWQLRMIQPTDEAASLHIFHDINPNSKDDPDIGPLLAALGHMPFAVTLMANLGKRSKSTAKDLLDTWYTSGTDMISVTNSPEKSMNRSISLSVDSEFMKQDPDALLLLAILSLLPAGTTRENLHWWAPTVKMLPSAIATLFDAALLVENKREDSNSPVLFILPVVQSFMQQQHGQVIEEIWKQIHSSCCQYVLDHACRYDDSTFSVNSKALAIEDTNIQSIIFSSSAMQHTYLLNTRTMEALIAFCWHRCDTKPNIELTNQTVTATKAFGIKRYIALAVWCLGRTYQQLGDHHLSYNCLKEAYQLFNTLPSDDLKSQQLCCQCGIDFVETVCLIDGHQAVSLAREVEKKCATLSDDIIHGRSLVFLGFALNRADQQQEALVHLDNARTMLKTVRNTPNLAVACQIIAWVHYNQERLPEALDAIEEAWNYAESIDSPYLQGIISQEFGTILFKANRDSEAWKYVEIALMKASHVGDRITIAHALQHMGYGYLCRGDYQNAYGAYEAAVENYNGTVYAWANKHCKDNMARIQQKLTNPNVVVGFHRHQSDCDKSFFYPPVQDSAIDTISSS